MKTQNIVFLYNQNKDSIQTEHLFTSFTIFIPPRYIDNRVRKIASAYTNGHDERMSAIIKN